MESLCLSFSYNSITCTEESTNSILLSGGFFDTLGLQTPEPKKVPIFPNFPGVVDYPILEGYIAEPNNSMVLEPTHHCSCGLKIHRLNSIAICTKKYAPRLIPVSSQQ